MNDTYDRREMLQLSGGGLLALAMAPHAAVPQSWRRRRRGRAGVTPSHTNHAKGCVVGQAEAAQVGADVLATGGNAVDAAVAGALVAGVVAVHLCGIGGYGGHMVIALAGGKKVTAIDFNSTAPALAREDMFALEEKAAVKGQVNQYGWLAAGVPGTLGGLQLALDRYGSQPLSKLAAPAIRYARDGFRVSKSLAAAIRTARSQLLKDPATAKLLLHHGEALPAGSTCRNPDLADLLQTLAERQSVDSFYRGDIARKIAAAFKKNGGLVREADLAAYRAREVQPLELTWRGYSIRTAPLTAGGLSVLEALTILKALRWDCQESDAPKTTHARLEALRIAWADRLQFLGDPDKVRVPFERLLSERYAERMAAQVEKAVKEGKARPAASDGRTADGTVHLSAADARGNLVALTLTHGDHFGAQVTVDGLGLLLGQGMSRFDPRPGHPNSPGPGKRPLHNMCPTIVLRDGRPIVALGGVGGRKIVNAVFDLLAHYVGRGKSLDDAVAAWRLHTEGDATVTAEGKCPARHADYLKQAGYTVHRGPVAVMHAISFDPKSGTCRGASR